MTVCTLCFTEYPDSRIQCPACLSLSAYSSVDDNNETVLLSDVSADSYPVIKSGFWDPIFAEPPGIVLGGVYIIGGMPGAGKSTLSLQIADAVCGKTEGETLYVGAEQPPRDLAIYCHRLNIIHKNRIRAIKQVTADGKKLEAIVNKYPPKFMVLDSLSALTSNLELQVDYCKSVKELAVKHDYPVFIVCHVNKQEDYAGLMKLQHAVDALIGIVSDDDGYHMLRAFKNRFGPTDRKIRLQMTAGGLREWVKPEKKGGKKNVARKIAH